MKTFGNTLSIPDSAEVYILPNWLRLAICYWILVGIVWAILRYVLMKEILPSNARNVFFGMAVLFAGILVAGFYLFFRTSIKGNSIEQGIIMRRRINAEHVDVVRRSLFYALVTSKDEYPILLLSPFFIKNQRDVSAALTKAAKGNEAMINFAQALSDEKKHLP